MICENITKMTMYGARAEVDKMADLHSLVVNEPQSMFIVPEIPSMKWSQFLYGIPGLQVLQINIRPSVFCLFWRVYLNPFDDCQCNFFSLE